MGVRRRSESSDFNSLVDKAFENDLDQFGAGLEGTHFAENAADGDTAADGEIAAAIDEADRI